MSEKKELYGVIPALITPLTKEKRRDEKLLERQIIYLKEAGVDGFFINGSTGDGVNLTIEEKIENFKMVKALAPDTLTCIAALKPSTEQTIEEIHQFEKLEPDFVVAVTPFYCSVPQNAIVEHFKKIALSTELPLILYNIPQCTQNKIEYSTLIELSKIKNIAAIKDSSGDFSTFSRWLYMNLNRDINLIQGEDLLDAPSLILGGNGIVTGMGNVLIEPYVAMLRAAKAKNWVQVNEMQKRINKLYEIVDAANGKVIPAIKAGTYLLGRGSLYAKTAGLELDTEEIDRVEKVLKGIL